VQRGPAKLDQMRPHRLRNAGPKSPPADQTVVYHHVAGDFPVTIFGAPADLDTLKRYAEAGVERVNFWVPPFDREGALKILDDYAAVANKGP